MLTNQFAHLSLPKIFDYIGFAVNTLFAYPTKNSAQRIILYALWFARPQIIPALVKCELNKFVLHSLINLAKESQWEIRIHYSDFSIWNFKPLNLISRVIP